MKDPYFAGFLKLLPKRRRWQNMVGFALFCLLSASPSVYSHGRMGAALNMFRMPHRAEQYLRQGCLQENARANSGLACGDIKMKGLKTERKGLPGAGKPAWIARGLARGENGDLFVVIEVVMNKEGHLIRYHPTYLDGSGTLIGRPRIGDDEAATNTTTPAKEYIEPAKDPEAYMPSEAIPPASVDLGPGYQLRAESQ